jgi:hypothetical protein
MGDIEKPLRFIWIPTSSVKRKRGRPRRRKTLLTGALGRPKGRPKGATKYAESDVDWLAQRIEERIARAASEGQRLSVRRAVYELAFDVYLERHRGSRLLASRDARRIAPRHLMLLHDRGKRIDGTRD